MSKANMGWLYYKELYRKGNDDTHIKKSFQKLLEINVKDESLNKTHSFSLSTTYPGLIIGSGYTHGISSEEDSKMGFYFDFTMGVPTIAGSSIKGVLRSLFGYSDKEFYKEQKIEFIQELLGKEIDVDTLAEEIFEGKQAGEAMSIYTRDKFYEARILKTSGSILQADYITPHKEALKNPVPLKIIKIAGGTSFEFSFDLHDSEIEGIKVTADEKLTLFFQLLQFHGLGAKTNVGYGQFEEKSVEKFVTEIRMKQEFLHEQEEKETKEKDALAKEKALQDALSSADTNVKKIELSLNLISDNKEIYELLVSYTLEDEEKSELVSMLNKKIGDMPENTPKNMKKAKTKWPIKIYEYLGK